MEWDSSSITAIVLIVIVLAIIIAIPELFGFIARLLYHKRSWDVRYPVSFCAAIVLFMFPLPYSLVRGVDSVSFSFSVNICWCVILGVYGFFFTMRSASRDPKS